MARDVLRLSAGDAKTYNDFKNVFGEAYADDWYDKNLKVMGIEPIPQVDVGAAGLDTFTPLEKLPPPAPILEQKVREEIIRPSVGQMQARLQQGDFAPRPSLSDVFLEEQKALESQTKRFVDLGEKTDQEVRLQIATELSSQGLSPIGPTSEEYKKRFEEEYGKASSAEKAAAEKVIGARQALTPGFGQKAPIVGASTLAKEPSQVERMTGVEAVAEALRPQTLETPDETTARLQKEENQRMFEQSASDLSRQKNISVAQAKNELLDGVKQSIYMDVVRTSGYVSQNELDDETQKRFLEYVRQELPTEYSRQLQEGDIGGDGISRSKEIATDIGTRGLEFLVGAAATDKYDPQIYKDVKQKLGLRGETEAVVESLPMTIVRDIAGISRFAFNPLLDLAFYDVQPGKEEKINPEEYGLFPRERTGAKEEGAWGKSYIASRTPGSVEDSLREIAVEIATARSLGDDLAAQAVVSPEQEENFRGLGLLAEVALPINVFSVPGKVAGGSSRAGRAFAKALMLEELVPGSVAEMFSDIAKVGELIEAVPVKAAEGVMSLPSSAYNAFVRNKSLVSPFVNAAKRGGVTLGDELTKSTKLLDAFIDSNKVSSIVAINTADQYNALRFIASGVPLEGKVGALIKKDAPSIWKAVTAPEVADPRKMAKKILEDISKSTEAPSSNTARSSLVPLSDAAVNSEDAYALSRQTLRNSLVEDLSDTSLGGWTFLTPNVVATTKTAKEVLPELVSKTKEGMEKLVRYDRINGRFVINDGFDPDVLNKLLRESVVQNSSRRNGYYFGEFFASYPGDVVTRKQYKMLHNLVAENAVYQVSKEKKLGAFAPSKAGRAIQSASEPIQLRSDAIQFTKQVTENVKLSVGNLVKKTFVNPPPAKYVDDVVTSYAGYLEGFPAQFSNTIRILSNAGLKDEMIYSALLTRTYASKLGTAQFDIDLAKMLTPFKSKLDKANDALNQANTRLAAYQTAKQNARAAGRSTTSADTAIRNAQSAIRDIERDIKLIEKRIAEITTTQTKKASEALIKPEGAILKPADVKTEADVMKAIPPLGQDDAVKAMKDIMKVQFNLDYTTPIGKKVSEIIDEAGRTMLSSELQNRYRMYDNATKIRAQILEQFPDLINQEAISQTKRGARLRGSNVSLPDYARVSSLPETVLAVVFEESKKKAFTEIMKANKPKIYDDIAIDSIGPLRGLVNSDKVVIDALNAGLFARLDNPGGADVLQAFRKSLEDAKVSNEVIDDLFNRSGDAIVDSINSFAIDAYRRSPGWMPVDGAQALRRLDSAITNLGGGGLELAVLPSNMQADIKFIQTQLANARKNPAIGSSIANIIEQVERQSPGLFGRIVGDIKALFGMSYGSMIEGMLAGRVMPNLTYITENVVGAPLIAAVTNPEYINTVFKNIRPILRESVWSALPGTRNITVVDPRASEVGSMLIDVRADFKRFGGYSTQYYERARQAPTEVVIRTAAGEEITNEDLWNLISEARLGRAQAQAVVDPRILNQIRDLTEILSFERSDAKMWSKEILRQFGDIAPSGRSSVPMTVATNADMAFRQELFVEALRRGANKTEAAAIARETLLDYNKLNEVLPSSLGALRKPFLFLSFSASMSLAMLKGMTRAEPAENILRIARAHRNVLKSTGIYAPDGALVEGLYVSQGPDIDGKPVAYTYLRDPVMGQLIWMGNLIDSFKGVVLGEAQVQAGTETFEQLGYVPWYDFVKDILTAKAGTVNARQVDRWQTLGMWELAQNWFDIEELPIKKMRAGEPTVDGRQYRFKTKEGKQKFLIWEQTVAIAGWNRTIGDYYNMLISSGAMQKGTTLARYSPGNYQFDDVLPPEGTKGFVDGMLYVIPLASAAQYAFLRQRAVRPPSQIEAYDRQIQTEIRKLKELQYEQVEE